MFWFSANPLSVEQLLMEQFLSAKLQEDAQNKMQFQSLRILQPNGGEKDSTMMQSDRIIIV